MAQLANNEANKFAMRLGGLLATNEITEVIIATHVPAYPAANVDAPFLPFFYSKVNADVIGQLAREYPDVRFKVLSGHTHRDSHLKIEGFHNVTQITLGAEYGRVIFGMLNL